MSYPEELGRELTAVGIRGRLARRITTEVRDHLECDPEVDLGSPPAIAAQFADELGTVRTRRAAFVAFGGLALAGILLVMAGLTAVQGFPHRHPHSVLFGGLGAAMVALGAQIAFVAGTLAMMRGLRGRRAPVMPRAEAIIVVRRAAIALVAGLAAVAGLALVAIEFDRGVRRSSTSLALVLLGLAALGLVAAAPTVLAAARLRPTVAGPRGDIFDDLGRLIPPPLRGHAWRFAFIVTGLVVVLVTAAGVGQQDPLDGAARGVADSLACLGCFALLGGYLGLRPARGHCDSS
jgi:hypothetical protein